MTEQLDSDALANHVCTSDVIQIIEQIEGRAAACSIILDDSSLPELTLWTLLQWERKVALVALEQLGVDLKTLEKTVFSQNFFAVGLTSPVSALVRRGLRVGTRPTSPRTLSSSGLARQGVRARIAELDRNPRPLRRNRCTRFFAWIDATSGTKSRSQKAPIWEKVGLTNGFTFS